MNYAAGLDFETTQPVHARLGRPLFRLNLCGSTRPAVLGVGVRLGASDGLSPLSGALRGPDRSVSGVEGSRVSYRAESIVPASLPLEGGCVMAPRGGGWGAGACGHLDWRSAVDPHDAGDSRSAWLASLRYGFGIDLFCGNPEHMRTWSRRVLGWPM